MLLGVLEEVEHGIAKLLVVFDAVVNVGRQSHPVLAVDAQTHGCDAVFLAQVVPQRRQVTKHGLQFMTQRRTTRKYSAYLIILNLFIVRQEVGQVWQFNHPHARCLQL